MAKDYFFIAFIYLYPYDIYISLNFDAGNCKNGPIYPKSK
jgi:hypothetical protein